MLVLLDSSHAAGQSAPDRHYNGQIYGWLDSDKEHIRRSLEKDIGDFACQQLNEKGFAYDIPKNTTREMLYSFDVSFRSVAMPAIFAFPILATVSMEDEARCSRILGAIHVR